MTMKTELTSMDSRRSGNGLPVNRPALLGNDEILMSKAERMTKHESPVRTNSIELACSGFARSGFFRRSSFVIGHSYSAFSLIEMIGVLAVIAILAAALAPSFVRQMDKSAGDQESAALKSFGEALQQSIMRQRYIPSATDWASTVATELGVDVTAVTDSPRRQPRFFLIDPNLNINNTGVTPGGNGEPALPYTQANAGSANLPASPRVLILSSIGFALPGGIVSGVPTAADFTNIWNSA